MYTGIKGEYYRRKENKEFGMKNTESKNGIQAVIFKNVFVF